ncbi:7TM diverse intracellular signaling domain-containing protein [Pseudochryseolinea flava]|uniref:Chromosome partitioning protein ParA n=1 Tax=Pseudochryseolinea flava TaxID=2059302 RepID=A0A364Y534_9BACT|nr:7TM diverse intracellular signaling domain-containing protein [Pseudochryseolinea flava]RAW02108.1 chromosome partitioning protein ParA [Pseudochryseolinea flava]
MKMWARRLSVVFILTIGISPIELFAQRPVTIIDSVQQFIFSFGEIEFLEDPAGTLSIDQVSSAQFNSNFKPSTTFSPINYNRDSYYWYRLKLRQQSTSQKRWQLEFFDQTIDRIDFFTPDAEHRYHQQTFGDNFAFGTRFLKHKNFVVHLPSTFDGEYTYYFKVKSRQRADILVVLRPLEYFFNYALEEYFFFGIFYGMILVFCFYNLLMFLAVRERHYLYYILYLVGIGLYEMSADGIAFQFLWPNAMEWNQYAPGFSLYIASTFSLFFAASLLNLRKQFPHLLWILASAFIIRTTYLIVSFYLSDTWFNYRFIEIIPFGAAFFAGIYALTKGYEPARLMVVGYSFLFLGIVIKVIQYLDFNWLPLGELTHYSLGFSFIMEMMFLSFAISDKIKVLRRDKEKAQELTIEQLKENQKLKDSLNEELEEKVNMKTKELVEKSSFIEAQNKQLADAYRQLEAQSDEIAAMNELLARDNIQLKHDKELVTEARILSKEVDFEEFSAMYPDDISCLKFLADIKWKNQFACTKCNHTNYTDGKSPYSRRCTRCGYDESVTAYTLLQNSRLPINKAFYMIFLVYSSNGTISSHKLSKILNIRQSTCWSYSTKIKKAMKDHRHHRGTTHPGWDSILLEEVEES